MATNERIGNFGFYPREGKVQRGIQGRAKQKDTTIPKTRREHQARGKGPTTKEVILCMFILFYNIPNSAVVGKTAPGLFAPK